MKEITDISRNSVAIEARLIALAAWMKEQYGGTMIQALKTVSADQAEGECEGKEASPVCCLTEEESQEKSWLFIRRRIRKQEQGFWKL